jgi:Ca2+-binding EF-hand superfamily protein
MKTRAKFTIVGAFAVALLGATAYAQSTPDVQHQPEGQPGRRSNVQELLQKYDLDGDGHLDQAERDALNADIQAGKVQRRQPHARGGGRPVNADSQAGGDSILEHRDANGAGQLNDAESAPAHQDTLPGDVAPPGRRLRHSSQGDPASSAHRQEILKKYDANGDGQLDDAERAALRQDIANGKIQPLDLGSRPPGAGRPGTPARREELLRRYDANGDGQLDETERAAFEQDVKDGKVDLPGRGFGPRAPRHETTGGVRHSPNRPLAERGEGESSAQ